MSSIYDNQTKERVRLALSIVDVIASYVEVRRQGRGFVARCPFHDDRRPSLQINVDRQSWKCWVCDVGGDIFSFVMQREGMTFPEAFQLLADKAGVVLEQPTGKPGGMSSGEKRELYRAMEWGVTQFRENLMSNPQALRAREYVESRGLNAETVARFQLGFAPESWSWLVDRAVAAKIPVDGLEKVGLLGRSNQGSRYDRFRDRLIFPIFDPQSRAIAVGGRILPGGPSDAAKYINCPETRLYQKNATLYGLNLARDRITKTRVAVVMEGYTDVMMAHQHGIDNAVACCGTALTENHIRLLKRYCDSVVLMLDGDEAGQKRTSEILELFLSEDMDLRVLTLPDGLDPCDFLIERGGEVMQGLIAGAVDALEFKIQTTCQGFDPLLDTHRATKALDSVLRSLAKMQGSSGGMDGSDSRVRLRVDQIIARLSRQFGIERIEIQNRLNDLRKQARRWDSNAKPPARTEPARHETVRPDPTWRAGGQASHDTIPYDSIPYDLDSVEQGTDEQGLGESVVEYRYDQLSPVELELLEIMVMHADLVPLAIERFPPRHLESETAKAIFKLYCDLELEGHALDYQSALTCAEDIAIKNILVNLEERAVLKASKASMDAAERLQTLCDRWHGQEETEISKSQRRVLEDQTVDEQEQLDVLQVLIRQARLKHGIEPVENPNL